MVNSSQSRPTDRPRLPLAPLFKTLTRQLLSLRGRLLLGAALLWTLLCLTLLAFGWQSGTLLVDETNRMHLRYEAELIRNDIAQQVNQRLTALERLAGRIPTPAEGALARQGAGHLEGLFDGLILVDTDSRILDDWPADAGRLGKNVGDRPYARFMHEVKRPHVSEPFVGRVSGSPRVMMLVPLRDTRGRYTGFVGGLVDIAEGPFFDGFDHLRLGDDGVVTITTASGLRLYQPRQRRSITPVDRQGRPWLDQALDGWEGEAQGAMPTGGEALTAYRQVWPARWVVGVYLPMEQAYGPLARLIERVGDRAFLALGLLLPLVALLLWLTLRSLTRLGHQIGELKRGQREQLTIPTRMGELRQIIDTFNAVEGERRDTLQHLHEQEAVLRGILAASPQAMFVTDTAGSITFVNPALEALLHLAPPAPVSRLVGHLHPDDREPVMAAWRESLAHHRDFERQFRYLDEQGAERWLDVHASTIEVADEVIGLVGVVRDITQRRHDDALRRWEAEHDPLTGLLNRRGFERRLEDAFADWEKAGTPGALVLFDLDRFKPINDEGGHALGDIMLQRVAEAIREVTRSSDHSARQGGDEFALLLNGCGLDQAMTIANALRERIAIRVVEQDGRAWRVTASLGVSRFAAGDTSAAAAIARADAASYRAKSAGRDGVASG
ncbi:PAS domain S-box-containing protein/diguanylate cyclase (GGDEF) domain-containing protein [Halomonas shengliensis]|uniref:PAS domain S-box-containing protein/diguanylate cyclase (GGDEF) domain-containing protein n=1 Tax=Halomonas shengliensis TaxID=419597 RepID=A0A1H0EX59_9GAMM|nr:diguanylate cyclase [Halomonas shengliensis]SDN86869.1 PAS domain S-box-containing protein/diguanylate cyclase (GGDEF) domain-containing protein [Halomonas shengliensis]